MTNNLSPTVVIFTILCLALVLNARKINFKSNHDDSSEDSAESSRPSSRRIILPWTSSNIEKKNLNPGDDKSFWKSRHGMLFFSEDFNSWDINKFFEYVESLLYGVNPNDGDSLDKSTDDDKTKIKNPSNMDDKLENIEKDELQNSTDADTPNQSVNNVKMQNSATTDSLNKTVDDEKSQNSATADTLNKSEDDVKSDGQKEDLTTFSPEDSKDNSMNEITLDDSTTNEEEVDEYDDYIDEEKETENEAEDGALIDNKVKNEDNKNENEVKDDKLEENSYKSKKNGNLEIEEGQLNKNSFENEDNKTENEVEDDNLNKNSFNNEDNKNENEVEDGDLNENSFKNEDNKDENEVEDANLNENSYKNENKKNDNEVKEGELNKNNFKNENKKNENEAEDDNVNKNNNDNVGNETSNNSQASESAVNVNKTSPNDFTIVPNLMNQTATDQQNNSESSVLPEDAKSHNITRAENPSAKFEPTDEEFIDDYINNRQRKIPEKENEQSNNTETLIPDESDATNKIIPIRIPTSGNNLEENSRPLNKISSVNENPKSQNMPFEESQNSGNIFLTEKNILPSPVVKEDTKHTIPNENDDENSPQNIEPTILEFQNYNSPTVFQPDMFSNQDAPNSPDETRYFTNWPEMPMNAPNIEKTATALAIEIPSNQLFNQDSSPTDIENSLIKLDKPVSQVKPDTTTLRNQINKIEELDIQSDNLPVQNVPSEQQELFPQNDTLQSKTNSRTPSDENKINSETLTAQNEFENIELPTSQNDTNNSKELPRSSFNNTGVDIDNQPGNVTFISNIPKNKTTENLDREYDEDESNEIESDEEDSNEIENDEEESDEAEYDELDYNEEDSDDFEFDEEESDGSEYNEEESYKKNFDKEDSKESRNLSNETISDAAMQMTQNSSSTNTNDVIESPATLKTESEDASSDQKEKFNTILEYIYKSSDNPMFKGLKD